MNRLDGGLPAACMEMGVSPQDIDAIANGHVPSPVVLNAIYQWLARRAALLPGEQGDYQRLLAAARQAVAVRSSGLPAEVRDAIPGTSIPPPKEHRGARTAVAIAAGAVVIVVVTVILTIVITRPGNRRAEANETPPSASPSAKELPSLPSLAASSSEASSPVLAVSDSPTAPPPSQPPMLIASYDNYELPCNADVQFGSGGPPQPVLHADQVLLYEGEDLVNSCGGDFLTGNGEVALLTGAPTYAGCAADTVYGSQLQQVNQGDTVCFQGHGVLATATVVGTGNSGGIDYTVLNVRVWQDPQADGGT
jgi:hypothetical protein